MGPLLDEVGERRQHLVDLEAQADHEGIYSDNVDASNLVDYLADKVGHENQIAPYFSERVWSPRTTPRSWAGIWSAKIKYCLDLLPTHNLPEERSQHHEGLHSTDIRVRSVILLLLRVRLHRGHQGYGTGRVPLLHVLALHAHQGGSVPPRWHDSREEIAGESLQASHGDVIEHVLGSASATPWVAVVQACDPPLYICHD